jgi:hypothetical protein
MMALHLWAFAGSSPAIEFLLQLLVGGYWFLGQAVALHVVQRLASSFGRDCAFYATVFLFMATRPQDDKPEPEPAALYCPNCAEEVNDPLMCGDCSSVICRRCGTALESSDELGIG